MATYYVRPDGNDANTGLGSAANQAWQSITKAFSSMVLSDASNTLYIAPGVYRGSFTLGVTPSISNQLTIAGDPTCTQFSGVSSGRIRITNYTQDNDIPASSQTLVCDTKTYFTLRNLHIEGYTNIGGVGVASFLNSKNYVVENCVFSVYRRSTGTSCIFCSSTTVTAINAVFRRCVIYGGYANINIQCPGSGIAYGVGVEITDCLFTAGGNGIIFTAPSEATTVANGLTIYNCSFFLFNGQPIYVRSSNTTNRTLINNSLIQSTISTGIDASSNTVTEDYNRFVCAVDRTGVTAGTNSRFGILSLDFDYSRLTGLQSVDFHAVQDNSVMRGVGIVSGAPTTDIFGVTWTSGIPDVGAFTYSSPSNAGVYNPTERNASVITIAPGETSRSLYLYLGATGITHTTTNLTASYTRNGQASVPITLVAQTPTGSYVSGGFCEVSAPYARGTYRLDVPNAAFDFGVDDVTIFVGGANTTNGAVVTCNMQGIAGNIVHIGPFKVIADGLGSDQPLDIVQGVQAPVSVQLVDANENGVDISGATVEAKVYNAIGSLIATYSCVPVYAADGRCTFQLTTSVTNTAGVYNVTLTRTIGGNIVVFGPMKMIVRAN